MNNETFLEGINQFLLAVLELHNKKVALVEALQKIQDEKLEDHICVGDYAMRLKEIAKETLVKTSAGCGKNPLPYERIKQLEDGNEHLGKEVDELREKLRIATEAPGAGDGMNENEKLKEEIRGLEIQLHQARGALGYPVPGDIPEGDFKCGLCEAKAKRILEAEAKIHTLFQVVRLFSEHR